MAGLQDALERQVQMSRARGGAVDHTRPIRDANKAIMAAARSPATRSQRMVNMQAAGLKAAAKGLGGNGWQGPQSEVNKQVRDLEDLNRARMTPSARRAAAGAIVGNIEAGMEPDGAQPRGAARPQGDTYGASNTLSTPFEENGQVLPDPGSTMGNPTGASGGLRSRMRFNSTGSQVSDVSSMRTGQLGFSAPVSNMNAGLTPGGGNTFVGASPRATMGGHRGIGET